MKQKTIEGLLEAIADNRLTYIEKLDTLWKNRSYSDEGRNKLAEQEWKAATQKHESLREELEDLITDERSRLEGEAFTSPRGSESAYRDVISKISSFTENASWEQAMQLAIKTSDTLTLRAMAAVSHSRDEPGWNTIKWLSKFDRDISNLVDFEKEHGVLREKAQKMFASYRHAPSKPNFPAKYDQPEIVRRNLDGTREF